MDLTKTDGKLFEISKKISFLAITPTNLSAEKERFFTRKNYNPQFTYEPYKTNLEIIKRELKSLKTDNSIMGKLLDEKRHYFLSMLSLLAYRGHGRFTEYSQRVYGTTDTHLVTKAKQLVNFTTHPEEKTLTTHDVIKKLTYALVKSGVHWSVKEKEMVAYAAVSPSKKVLLVKKNTLFSEKFLKRLIVHEIGTHIIRAENGLQQPYKLFFYGLPGYLTTEEGLCVVNEQLNDCLNNLTLKNYAGRVLAIQHAFHGSFRQTYHYLQRYFSDETAWKLTVRAKRGLGDTSAAGAFTKDSVYLRGYLQVKDYWYRHRDLSPLYYGRISLDHIPLLPKIKGLKHPMYLPPLRYLQYVTGRVAVLCKEIVRSL